MQVRLTDHQDSIEIFEGKLPFTQGKMYPVIGICADYYRGFWGRSETELVSVTFICKQWRSSTKALDCYARQ
ncbi:hypothetical protein KS4_21660 [Poriferisphaera corsica]|uniref:Uncharacterized protein n=1 Tax=Poriferisphaera corsica TaxID=2528020 RepID=A0A517YV56_9BACT|nr:hypothetical protein KS4_21660 [Poriferisphaera corsica]